MGSESMAHEAERRMGYWFRGHEGERNNCFSKIQLVGQKYRDKPTLAIKTRVLLTRGSYNEGSYNQVFLQLGDLQPGVFTT